MTYRRFFPWCLALLPASATLTGQVQSPSARVAAKVWTQPRTPDGQPDIQGNWNNSTLTQLERPRQFANKQFLSEQETVALESEMAKQGNWDRPGRASAARHRARLQLSFLGRRDQAGAPGWARAYVADHRSAGWPHACSNRGSAEAGSGAKRRAAQAFAV